MKTLRKPLFLAAITIAGQLYAQPIQPLPPAPPLSSEDMARAAASLGKQVTADLNHIQAVQASVRREKDSLKLDCVNEQFFAAKASANVFEKQTHNLDTAVDSSARSRAFGGVSQNADNVHRARERADRCAGTNELSNDNNTTRPDLADNPTEGGTQVGMPGSGNGGGLEPPAYTSPYN